MVDVLVNGSLIRASYEVRGYRRTFYPPSMLNYMSFDYGFENDLNDDEEIQRSTIANASTYLGMKASQPSYRIRGEISEFDVLAIPLFLISDETWTRLPADHLWTGNDVYGNLLYYTDIAPRYLHFDDIAADVQYQDPDTGMSVALTDHHMMYNDLSADGKSIGLAFGLDVASGALSIVSCDALTEKEANALRIVDGFRIVLSMSKSVYDSFRFRRGIFGLTPGYPPILQDTVYWLDIDEGYDEGLGQWTVIAGGNVSILSDPKIVGGAQVCALRYWPSVELSPKYSRSHRIVLSITPRARAFALYGSGDRMVQAVQRLIGKIEDILRPIHVSVLSYVINRNVSVSAFPMVEHHGVQERRPVMDMVRDVTLESVVGLQDYLDWPGMPADGIPADRHQQLVVVDEHMESPIGTSVLISTSPVTIGICSGLNRYVLSLRQSNKVTLTRLMIERHFVDVEATLRITWTTSRGSLVAYEGQPFDALGDLILLGPGLDLTDLCAGLDEVMQLIEIDRPFSQCGVTLLIMCERNV